MSVVLSGEGGTKIVLKITRNRRQKNRWHKKNLEVLFNCKKTTENQQKKSENAEPFEVPKVGNCLSMETEEESRLKIIL